MEFKDYYKTLGVEKKASQDEIKSAFRKLAKEYHPDLHPGDAEAEKKFKEVNEAYEVLGDKEKRKQYDTFGSSGNFTGGQNFDPSQYGFDYTYTGGGGSGFSDFFDMFFGGFDSGGGASRSTGRSARDIFSGFGTGGPRSTQRQRYDTELSVSLKDAYEGTSKDLNLSINGSTKRVNVKVPRGITPGKKIKIKGEKVGLDNSDIYVKINVVESEVSLDGLNLSQDIKVYPWEAGLGTTKLVDTFHGKIRVRIPEGIESGKKIRIGKKGFKDMKDRVGDYYLRVVIDNPTKLTDQQRELYEKLAETE